MIKEDIILVYQLAQLPMVQEYLRTAEKVRVVAMDFWIEKELQKNDIPHESFSKYRLTGEELAPWHKVAQDIAREWYRIPEVSFFTHKGIRLGEAVEPAVEAYLQGVLYYFAPLRRLFTGYGEGVRMVVPRSVGTVSPTSGPFTLFELNAVVDIVRLLAQERGLAVKEIGDAPGGVIEPYPRQRLSVLVLRIVNNFVKIFAPRRPLKIFASETWAHIDSFVVLLKDAELVLMDRKEAQHAGLRAIWTHRMRFIHPLDTSKKLRKSALEIQQHFAALWQNARPAVSNLPQLTVAGMPIWPLLAPALDFFVTKYVQRLVFEAESLMQIYNQEHIQKIILRASVSGRQPHFFIAAKIGMQLGIPSIELQHAGAVLDPNSVHSRMEASYLAGYGALTRDLYCKFHGYVPDRIRTIGSPRFDRYLDAPALSAGERERELKKIGLDPARPVALVAVPADLVGLMLHIFDTYANAELYEAMKRLRDATPGLQILFKFRRGNYSPRHREYLRELFQGKDYAAVDDDLFYRIGMSDVVISHNSTTMYEAMIAGKPLVLYPWRHNDPAAAIYTEAAPMSASESELTSVVGRILNDASYRQELVKQGSDFLSKNYSFDGHSSERMIDLLHEDLKP